MMHEEYKHNGTNYIRIDKRKARIKYYEGKTIRLIGDGAMVRCVWDKGSTISNADLFDFSSKVSRFQHDHNNCGVKYFIRQEDCV